MRDSVQNDEIINSAVGVALAALSLTFLPVAIYVVTRWKYDSNRRLKLADFAWAGVGGICLYGVWIGWLDRFPLYAPEGLHLSAFGFSHPFLIGARIVWVWCSVGLAVYLLMPFILSFKNKGYGLRAHHFGQIKYDLKRLKKLFRNENITPLGVDVKTGDLVGLEKKVRTAHVLIIGATGTGKTTLMINQILHAVLHNQPVVVIDPKGEDSTLSEIKRLGRVLDPRFDERFKLFSMSKPGASCHYNPLKHGNANQLKDRIMEALTWSEPYYQNVSASFLTTLTAAIEFLGLRLNFRRLSAILVNKEEQSELLRLLKFEFEKGNSRALELFKSLEIGFGKGMSDALSGLSAQISILNNPTFGHLLSFEDSLNELDFREIRKHKGIAYFQLDTLGNGDSARRLGRMIIEDLKSLSSEVYKTEECESSRPFFPIFIDEFGSFASSEFIEFLKQSRGAQFGLHLFCQGLEDLDVVSPEFRRQIISNAMTKIALRVDDNETVNEFCSTAGTFDALEQSYQVEGSFMVTKTGMGNMRHTKQMQIEHDVLKRLKTGQAVVIKKSPEAQVYGIQIPQPDSIL